MVDVTIAIASCGRPSLVDTLKSLDRLDVPGNLTIEIVVADDDPSGGAADVVATAGPWKNAVRSVAVGRRNISHARNACLEAAKGHLLAFLDDDEWVADDWLKRMLACQREFDATCVFGPVFPQYPDGTPAWLVKANPLFDDWGRRGTSVTTGRSGNVLFDRTFTQRHGIRFDPALGSSGGEDTAFFGAVHRAGGTLIATDDAAVYEHVPAERLSLAYLKTRALRTGQSYARLALGECRTRAERALFAADASLKMTAGFVISTGLFPISRASSLRFAIKGWSNLGKLRDVAGLAMTPMYHPDFQSDLIRPD